MLAPFFSEYANYIANYDGRMVVVNTDPDTFQPDLNRLEAAITARTKAVILNTPNNPTGVIYSAETLSEMAALFARKEQQFNSSIYVISDEPYREIVYDGAQVPFVLDFFRNGFIGYSYSKSLSLPGERIGYIAVNNRMDDYEDILSSLNVATRILGFVNAPSLFQKVIARTLGAEVDVQIYRENRDLIYNHLTKLGFSCVKPQGAFYLFPKSPIADEKAFCEAAKKHNILLVPGSSFAGPGHFRLSYCVSKEQILRRCRRLLRWRRSFFKIFGGCGPRGFMQGHSACTHRCEEGLRPVLCTPPLGGASSPVPRVTFSPMRKSPKNLPEGTPLGTPLGGHYHPPSSARMYALAAPPRKGFYHRKRPICHFEILGESVFTFAFGSIEETLCAVHPWLGCTFGCNF